MTNEALNRLLENAISEKEDIDFSINDCRDELNKINVRLHRFEGELRNINKVITSIKNEIKHDTI